MQIETVEMGDCKAKLILRDCTPALANALRRTMLQDIPKMAIDKVEFHLGEVMSQETDEASESITPLFDEVIAHRIGLVPIPTDYESFTFQDQCECGGVGCPHCSIMYSLNKTGPATVLSEDLQPLGDKSLAVKDGNIPIVELTKGQAIIVYGTAVMGTARKHVKWQAAFGVGYSYMPVITVKEDKAADPEVIKAALENYPGLFEEKNGKLVVADIWKAPDFGKGIGADLPDTPDVLKDFATVDWDDSEFLFKYETDGSLTAQQVLDKAIEIVKAEAADVSAQIDALA
ncbi:DNA-directed RNA polymerase, alpha subunit/40 kD subunit [Thermoplasmatales archaeon BRNA1]|nr:DNA-directed RNA polymerase, alpha subunit/40 kD subunit [Thermoplasmatales archaeon BRNA1]